MPITGSSNIEIRCEATGTSRVLVRVMHNPTEPIYQRYVPEGDSPDATLVAAANAARDFLLARWRNAIRNDD